MKRRIKPERIIEIVADYFDISQEILLSRDRKIEIVQKRQIAQYLISEYLDMSLTEIGLASGKFDHATILHSVKTVNDYIDTGNSIAKDILKLKEILDVEPETVDPNPIARKKAKLNALIKAYSKAIESAIELNRQVEEMLEKEDY
jgi:hypothetical protein